MKNACKTLSLRGHYDPLACLRWGTQRHAPHFLLKFSCRFFLADVYISACVTRRVKVMIQRIFAFFKKVCLFLLTTKYVETVTTLSFFRVFFTTFGNFSENIFCFYYYYLIIEKVLLFLKKFIWSQSNTVII